MEMLEDRTVPSTFIVTTTQDSGAGSLRQAITDANAQTGPNTITFNLAANDANHLYYQNDGTAGHVSRSSIATTTATDDSLLANPDPDWAHSWWAIKALTPLPTITDAVLLDGYSQAGASANTLAVGDNAVLKVELDGSGATSLQAVGLLV